MHYVREGRGKGEVKEIGEKVFPSPSLFPSQASRTHHCKYIPLFAPAEPCGVANTTSSDELQTKMLWWALFEENSHLRSASLTQKLCFHWDPHPHSHTLQSCSHPCYRRIMISFFHTTAYLTTSSRRLIARRVLCSCLQAQQKSNMPLPRSGMQCSHS